MLVQRNQNNASKASTKDQCTVLRSPILNLFSMRKASLPLVGLGFYCDIAQARLL